MEVIVKKTKNFIYAALVAVSLLTPARLMPQEFGYALPSSYDAAYAYRIDTPDPVMQRVPRNIDSLRTRNPDEYLKQLAAYITENATDGFDLVKKAHDLVALTIRYDAAGFWSGRIGDQSYQNVLKTRVAVCEGYATLFKRLCGELGVPCDIVHGYARGVGTSPLSAESPYASNHAWNIVTVNGEGYFIDSTWNAGHMAGRTARQDYNTDWLFIRPEHYIYTHFPYYPEQQLLAKPLSAEEFTALPFIRPKFFEVAENFSVPLTKIMQVENSLSIEYTRKEDFYYTVVMSRAQGGRRVENRSFRINNGETETVHFTFPEPGQYSVNFYWWNARSRQGEGCAEFIVEASAGSDVQYPTVYSNYFTDGEILGPIETPLKRGETYTFRVMTDRKVVSIIYGRNFIQLTKDADGVFTKEFTIPSGIRELNIGLADYASGRHSYLARYRVE